MVLENSHWSQKRYFTSLKPYDVQHNLFPTELSLDLTTYAHLKEKRVGYFH